jgi:biotin operon repressor
MIVKLHDKIYKIQQQLQTIDADGEGRGLYGKAFRFTSLRHLQKVLLPIFAEHGMIYYSYWNGDLYTVAIAWEDAVMESSIRVNTDQPHYNITAITSTYTKNMLMKLLGLVSEGEEISEEYSAQVTPISPADLAKAVQQAKEMGADAETVIEMLEQQGYLLSEGNKKYLTDAI